jgi:hypothetical protein
MPVGHWEGQASLESFGVRAPPMLRFALQGPDALQGTRIQPRREVGSVEPGKRAHLLLMRQDPLNSAAAYDAIDTVILAGVPIPRAALSARRPQ